MYCSKCKKEITNDSKFCEFCGNKIKIESSAELVKRIINDSDKANLVKAKRIKWLHFGGNAILILSIFILATFFLSVSYNLEAESMLLAALITIIISFIYIKIAKKFNL